jgi:hypothetical protein
LIRINRIRHLDEKTENIPNDTNDINRKEAIKKMGKYAVLTAMGTFLILSPKKAPP